MHLSIFSTAFDCIHHNLLFYALVKKGVHVHGNFIKVIQSMYKSLKSCVKTPQGLRSLIVARVQDKVVC